MLQCVAVCCSVYCSVYCSVLQCVIVCFGVLSCVAVYCSVLQDGGCVNVGDVLESCSVQQRNCMLLCVAMCTTYYISCAINFLTGTVALYRVCSTGLRKT